MNDLVNEVSNAASPIRLMFVAGILGLLPFAMTLVTSYIKISVVILLIRNALGVQQAPPTMVVSGLTMILSIFVMAPVGVQTYDKLKAESYDENASFEQIMDTTSRVANPLKDFLIENTDKKVANSFANTAKRIWPKDIQDSIENDSFVFVVPSFVISELTKAFEIGFLVYLPFIAIDLIISNILLAMGMMMVSPMTISLPFKLLLFVSLDGWLKLCEGLLYSYNYT